MPSLSKPLVVPQYGNLNSTFDGTVPPHTVSLFAAQSAGTTQASIDMPTVYTALGIDPANFAPCPNACVAFGSDLYVAMSAFYGLNGNGPSAAILKFTGYFKGNDTTATVQASIFDDAQNSYTGLACNGQACSARWRTTSPSIPTR